MSFAVVRGPATRAQLDLDRRLDAVVAQTGREEDRYSLGRLLFAALSDRPHFVNTIECTSGEEFTNATLLEQSVRTARALRDAGVVKGDVVIVMGVKHGLLAVPYYAATFIGAVTLHVDENATASEIEHYVKLAEPKCIFSDSNKLGSVDEALSSVDPAPRVISFGQQVSPDHQSLVDFIRDVSADLDSFQVEDVERFDTAILSCSSGSTGAPKAVALTNYGLVAGLVHIFIGPILEAPESQRKVLLLSSCQWLSYILYVNLCTVMYCTRLQSKQPSTARHTLEMLRKYQPDYALLPPGIATEILQSGDYRAGDLSSLRTVLVGAAYVSTQLQIDLKKAIHQDGEVIQGCGCTELCGMFSVQTPDCPLESIGGEINTLEYKIVDDNEKEVNVGETGELWVRGNGLYCKGYYRDEISTKDTFTADGWIKTGDLLYRNEKGQLFYVDRKKLLIKYGSYHIYPLEVEGVIQEVAGVAKAGVCMTERGLAALVETAPGATVTAQQVHDAVNSKLSYYKQLTGGVLFASALPQTVSGKLDRTALKALICKLQANTENGTN